MDERNRRFKGRKNLATLLKSLHCHESQRPVGIDIKVPNAHLESSFATT